MTSNGDLPNYPNHPPVREIVTVFWDYENCPCPMSTKIATLTYDIKRRIDHFIGKKLNKRIQLYCPMQRLHERTRENATDLGILMMDVASKRKQESVDKRIIADIGLFATELAESCNKDMGHIVLVSGDSDYGYILARLRDKSYIGKVIIFINDYTKETLIQHADHTHCLFQSNLTRKENPFSDINQRKINPTHKISSYDSRSMYQYTAPPAYNHNTPHHFQLNNTQSHAHAHAHTQPWNNSYLYNSSNGNNISTYRNGKTHTHTRTHTRKTPSLYRHSVNTASFNTTSSFGASILKNHKQRQNHNGARPTGGYTQNNVKILQKDENKEKSIATNTAKPLSYVYRRKEHKSPEIISAPPPIPPKPLTPPSQSNGSASSHSSTASPTKSHRIVSQENLEQQLKQAQKQKEKENEKKKEKLKASSSDITAYKNSADIDGISGTGNVSTFSVGSLYKINECNDEESKSKFKVNKRVDISADFFETMITPNQQDMDQLFKDIAPKVNVLLDKGNKKLSFAPKTSHIIDLKKIRMKSAPKKILKKKMSNTVITDQLRLVWDALCFCQKNSNNTPRRAEIYVAMKKTHGDYMKNRDMNFANECIDACLSYGTVEEMIKGRISSLYILPVILNALTSNDSTFYKTQTQTQGSTSDKTHVWITLDALKEHLCAGYTNHLSTYFTLTYLYRIIRNATRLFAFHKEDKNSENNELNHGQLAQIRFRVRKGAYNNTNNSSHYNNNRQYNNYNNNLTFNYYS